MRTEAQKVRDHERYLVNREKHLEWARTHKEERRKYYIKHRDERLKYGNDYYITHKPERIEYGIDYRRKHVVMRKNKTNGPYFYGLEKAPCPEDNRCPFCRRVSIRAMHWHHWDDNKPEDGVWLCPSCHSHIEQLLKRTWNRDRFIEDFKALFYPKKQTSDPT